MTYHFTTLLRSIFFSMCLFIISGPSFCLAAEKEETFDCVETLFFQAVKSRFEGMVTSDFEQNFRERISEARDFLGDPSVGCILSLQNRYVEEFYAPSSLSPKQIQADLLKIFSLFVDIEYLFDGQKPCIVPLFAYKSLGTIFFKSGLKDSFAFLRHNKVLFGGVQFDGDEKTMEKIEQRVPFLKIDEEMQPTKNVRKQEEAYGNGKNFNYFIDENGNIFREEKKEIPLYPKRKDTQSSASVVRSPLRPRNQSETPSEKVGKVNVIAPPTLREQEN